MLNMENRFFDISFIQNREFNMGKFNSNIVQILVWERRCIFGLVGNTFALVGYIDIDCG